MAKHYITFGSAADHNHTVAGTHFGFRRIAEVEAANVVEARSIAFRMFGTKWSHSYRSKDEAGVELFGLTVVPLTDAMIRDELMNRESEHLGDSIYAKYDGTHIILQTSRVVPSRAIEPQSETIYLRSDVLDNLIDYAKRVRKGE